MQLPPFYPILDTALLESAGLTPTAAAEILLDAGARVLQLRHKQFFSRKVFAEAQTIAKMCAATGAFFVINDRADMAALLGAAVHVGQDDLSPRDARKVLPEGAVIGLSTHNREQLTAGLNEPVNYFAIGPIYSTRSKANPDPVVGIEGLRQLRPLTGRPLVAIGGITRTHAQSVLAAGADSIAVISDLLPDLKTTADEWIEITSRGGLRTE